MALFPPHHELMIGLQTSFYHLKEAVTKDNSDFNAKFHGRESFCGFIEKEIS